MITRILLLTTLFLTTSQAIASVERIGKFYGYHGWNVVDYTNSTYYFKGKGHEFTLHDVKAEDRQTEVTFEKVTTRYLNPMAFTIPQYNTRFGYFITNNLSVSLGWDHMKYVMTQDQTVKMTGYIDTSASTDHAKTEAEGAVDKTLSSDFLSFEHSDGFNALTIETEYYHSVWSPSKGFDLSLLVGGGGGIMYPKTNAKLFGQNRNDEWHLAGWTASVKAGAELTGWDNFFFRGMVKQGYADMYDVYTTPDHDKMTHTVFYTEYYGVFGYRF